MRRILAPAAAALLALPLAAQSPHIRPAVQVDTTTTGIGLGPSVSSDGSTSAIVYYDGGSGGSNVVYAVTSDGRGISWSAPIRLDGDTTAATKFTQSDSCWVHGSSIYAFWKDNRNDNAGTTSIQENDIFVNVSHDGGATWMGERMVDKGYAAGTSGRTIRDHLVYADDNGTPANGADDHLYVLHSVEGPTNGNEELWLAASHDGGATWGAATSVSALGAGVADVDFIGLHAQGTTVYVVWQDNRFGGTTFDDVWFQRSTDGGATWQPADLQLNNIASIQGDAEFELEVRASGSLVVALWQEERATTNEELQVNVSTDGGVTWRGAVTVGAAGSGIDVDLASGVASSLVVEPSHITVLWVDARNGPGTADDDAFVSVSTDLGVTWSADLQLSVDAIGGAFPTFGRPRPGQDVIVATWSSDATFPNTAESAFSRDGGMTWSPLSSFPVSTTTGDVDFAEIGFNTAYNNAISAWLSDDLGSNRVFAGGYRPQTLTPTGTFSAGQVVRFEASNWPAGESGSFFGVLASAASGSYLLPDGRVTGLANDAYLAQSIGLIRQAVTGGGVPGALVGTIGAGGTGSTANLTFPGSIPPGTTLHLVAVGFAAPPLSLGSITDVETVVVQ